MPIITVKSDVNNDGDVLSTDEVLDNPIVSFFEIDKSKLNSDDKAKISEISKWLDSQSDDLVKRFSILKDMRYRLGSPQLGQTMLSHLHHYIMLRKAASENEAAAKAMEQ